MDPQQAQSIVRHFIATMFPLIVLFWLVKVTLYIIPLWQVSKKAGLGGPLALLAAIPLIGRMLVLYIIGFSRWQVVPAPQLYPGLQPYPPPPVNYPPPPPASYMPPPPTQL